MVMGLIMDFRSFGISHTKGSEELVMRNLVGMV